MRIRIARQASVFAGVLLLWAVASHFGQVSEAVLPPVEAVFSAALSLLTREGFWPALAMTVRDAAIGLTIALLIAVPAGLVIGSSRFLERSTRFLVDFGRSFPQVALIPILLTILGATSTMKIVLIVSACIFPILLQTIYGARRMDETLADTVRAYRIPLHLRYFHVLLPAASPFIMTGFRISVVVSILVAIAVEITSPVAGMGRELARARDFYETDVAIAYALYAGLLGVIVNLLADQAEKTLLSWHFRAGEV
ncbi:ABC transporter permease [Nioella sp.]|uniref:ABC transporter permease n=1 Tax=Nioella sp. TaxID=1912091 RepID=UPI003515245C